MMNHPKEKHYFAAKEGLLHLGEVDGRKFQKSKRALLIELAILMVATQGVVPMRYYFRHVNSLVGVLQFDLKQQSHILRPAKCSSIW